eukprot:3730539-Amphidinium_carterae.2
MASDWRPCMTRGHLDGGMWPGRRHIVIQTRENSSNSLFATSVHGDTGSSYPNHGVEESVQREKSYSPGSPEARVFEKPIPLAMLFSCVMSHDQVHVTTQQVVAEVIPERLNTRNTAAI